MKYARVENNTVVEILTPIPGFTIDQCFHADILTNVVPVDDTVQPGWTLVDGAWTAPAAPTGV
jgi:hypothetical protein